MIRQLWRRTCCFHPWALDGWQPEGESRSFYSSSPKLPKPSGLLQTLPARPLSLLSPLRIQFQSYLYPSCSSLKKLNAFQPQSLWFSCFFSLEHPHTPVWLHHLFLYFFPVLLNYHSSERPSLSTLSKAHHFLSLHLALFFFLVFTTWH